MCQTCTGLWGPIAILVQLAVLRMIDGEAGDFRTLRKSRGEMLELDNSLDLSGRARRRDRLTPRSVTALRSWSRTPAATPCTQSRNDRLERSMRNARLDASRTSPCHWSVSIVTHVTRAATGPVGCWAIDGV